MNEKGICISPLPSGVPFDSGLNSALYYIRLPWKTQAFARHKTKINAHTADMKKRTLILTTAAVCLAASLMLIINFSFRRAAEPAFLGDRFSAASVCAVREPTYEHMRERIKEYKKYREQIGKDARAQKPLRPERMLRFCFKI